MELGVQAWRMPERFGKPQHIGLGARVLCACQGWKPGIVIRHDYPLMLSERKELDDGLKNALQGGRCAPYQILLASGVLICAFWEGKQIYLDPDPGDLPPDLFILSKCYMDKGTEYAMEDTQESVDMLEVTCPGESLEIIMSAFRGRKSPLHAASSTDNPKLVEQLLARGTTTAQVKAALAATDDDGWTPLGEACVRGSVACVRLLLEAGADVQHGWVPGRRDPRWVAETALHAACFEGYEMIVTLLLEHNAKPDPKGSKYLNNAAFRIWLWHSAAIEPGRSRA